MKKISHRYIQGMSLMSCFMCDGDAPSDCWDGVESGYLSCAECHEASGPKDRNCETAGVPAYLKLVDSTGKGPAFVIRGDLRITGKVINVRTKKPMQRLPVKLVFPNGLSLSTRTKTTGKFILNIESYEGRQAETIDVGTLSFRKTGSRGFIMGFALNMRGAGARQ